MLSRNMAKVLLVGSGMTGSATAALIRQNLPAETNISVWDKGRGAGGRMATSRCPEDGRVTADLGAQYITLTDSYKTKRQGTYYELFREGILSPLKGHIEGPNNFDKPGAEHFVTPHGVSSLVKHFLKKAKADVHYTTLVKEVNYAPGGQVSVKTDKDETQSFDAVIVTVPVPQILQLQGSLHDEINNSPDILSKLKSVSYSSRYALAMFFPSDVKLDYPWCAKYISDNPCVRFIGIDQAKRGVAASNQGQSIVVHTSVPFGLAHLEEDLSSVQEEVLSHVRTILPDLPQPMSVKPQRWRYSQVHHSYQDAPGCVTLSTDPLVVLAGDAFAMSTFDGCLDSAEAVLAVVKDHLTAKTTAGL